MSKWYQKKQYSTQHYIRSDRSAKATWWMHQAITNGVCLNGLLKDEGKVCDLYSDKDEYEVMHNQGSWSNGEFPFEMMLVHHRKDPKKYTRPGFNSYYVQFSTNFEFAQVAQAKDFIKTFQGFEAPAFRTWTERIHPFAHSIGRFIYSSIKESDKAIKLNAKS